MPKNIAFTYKKRFSDDDKEHNYWDSEFQSEGMAHHVQEPQRRRENDDFKLTSKNLIKLLQMYLLVEVNSRG